MVIAEKSKLVRRICALGEVFAKATVELDDILQAVLSWAPENDAHPTDVVAKIFPTEFGPAEEPEGSSEEGSGVYFETRTTADLAPTLVQEPQGEPALDSD